MSATDGYEAPAVESQQRIDEPLVVGFNSNPTWSTTDAPEDPA